MVTAMALLANLFAVVCTLQADAGEEMERFRGAWSLLSTADERNTDPGSDSSQMVVEKGGRVVFKIEQVVTNRGDITLGSSGKLRTIDLKLADGRTLLGVYELKGEELTLCFAEAGKLRPAGVRPKGTQWAERWKRERQ